MFNEKRLALARKRRRLTAKRLAELAGVSPMTIGRLERGENQPDDATVSRLASALGYPAGFFAQDDPEEIDAGAVSFRSLSKMSAREEAAALAASALGVQLVEWIEERFSLPEPRLPDLSVETDAEAAARYLRQSWALGDRPIGSLVSLLEANGIRVLALAENTASVDAFSFWRDGKPFVFLNNFKSAERSRFDAAHELGHLVLHKHGGPTRAEDVDQEKPHRVAEREADAFASAFLMPANDVRARFPRPPGVETILRGKARWRVSAMALTYRLRTVGRLSEWQYKSACTELGRRGYRSGEPIGIERETSAIWRKVLTQLWSDRITKNDIAEQLHVPLDEVEGLVWGLAGTTRTGNGTKGFRSIS